MHTKFTRSAHPLSCIALIAKRAVGSAVSAALDSCYILSYVCLCTRLSVFNNETKEKHNNKIHLEQRQLKITVIILNNEQKAYIPFAQYAHFGVSVVVWLHFFNILYVCTSRFIAHIYDVLSALCFRTWFSSSSYTKTLCIGTQKHARLTYTFLYKRHRPALCAIYVLFFVSWPRT